MSDYGKIGISDLKLSEPLIFERGAPGRRGASLPPCDVPEDSLEQLLPEELLREEVEGFPEVSEVEVVRHFTRLSQWNFGVDHGFYPLGSCTMKYNPKVNEEAAALKGFSKTHPYQPQDLSQGILQLMYELEAYLCEISGMDKATLQPAAGAHGELTGLMLIKAYHQSRGERRNKVILPDSSHGTNPASSSLCGYQVIELASGRDGCVDPARVAEVMNENVAAMMLTNPNTLGLFEQSILEIARIVHDKGGLLHCDGANLNALMGIARPGDMGFDVIQFNLHKTFSTPHGGGGPGAGSVGVKEMLAPYLPVPLVVKNGHGYALSYDVPDSIGKVRSFYGNVGTLVRAYAYIRSMGPEGLKKASEAALINANYLMARLRERYHKPYDKRCMHEFVITDKLQNRCGVHTMDISKRLMDYGYHPPTVYFPTIVKGAMMIEPTETESKEDMDRFVDAMLSIADEAENDPELVKSAPHETALSRLNEALAARRPDLRWRPNKGAPGE